VACDENTTFVRLLERGKHEHSNYHGRDELETAVVEMCRNWNLHGIAVCKSQSVRSFADGLGRLSRISAEQGRKRSLHPPVGGGANSQCGKLGSIKEY
jgi:hypothetical protein